VVDQPFRHVDLRTDRDVRAIALHPHEPVQEQRIPQAVLAPDRHEVLPADGHADVVPCTLPDLDQCRCVAKELVARRGQLRAGLVADEQLPVELILQHANPGTHGGLGDVEVRGSPDEAPCLHNLEEGPGGDDVHLTAEYYISKYNSIHLLVRWRKQIRKLRAERPNFSSFAAEGDRKNEMAS
jgi:hypothetical protein